MANRGVKEYDLDVKLKQVSNLPPTLNLYTGIHIFRHAYRGEQTKKVWKNSHLVCYLDRCMDETCLPDPFKGKTEKNQTVLRQPVYPSRVAYCKIPFININFNQRLCLLVKCSSLD